MDSQLEFEFFAKKVLLSIMALSRFHAWYSEHILFQIFYNIQNNALNLTHAIVGM
jgi:hypothetical protein